MSFKAYLTLVSLAGMAAQAPSDLREAARLDQIGRCTEAEAIYQRVLAQNTPGPAVLNNAGNHYLACGHPAKARHYFERLVRAVPSHLNGNLQLALLSMRDGQFSQAEAVLRKLATAHPGNFDVLFLLGRAFARTGQLARSRETLESALRVRPDDVGAMFEGGLANAALGDFPRAVFLLARAQNKAPNQPDIALALARASEEAGYYGDSVLAYDRYLQLQPKDDTARRDRARALALTINGRNQGIQELERYVAGHPGDATGHFYLAQLVWTDSAERALASLAEAVRIDPRLASAHVARAWLLHRAGKSEEALSHLEAALRIAPDDVRALDQFGVVLLSLDRISEAQAALRKAAAIAPKDAEVALHLGRALMDQGKEQEGQHWLDAYQKLRPQRKRDARRESGMIELATLDAAGRRAREIERFRSMAKARPDDPLLQLHLAELLLADGQTSEALREYRTLSTLNGDTAIWAQAGRTLLHAGEHDTARLFLERAESPVDLAEALLLSAGPARALAILDKVPVSEQTAEHRLLKARALDAAGRADESTKWLTEALHSPLSTSTARQASLLLAKHGRYGESLEVLGRAMAAAPADGELRLTDAIVRALSGDTTAAGERLQDLEGRWPEWNRPWLAHALLLKELRRSNEAQSRFRAAAALGASEAAASCESLREWAFGTCGK